MNKTLLSVVALMSSAQAETIVSGATVGVHLGYANVKSTNVETLFFESVNNNFLLLGNGTLNTSGKSNGFIFDAAVGYREVFANNFMIGLELAVSKITGKTTMINIFDLTTTAINGHAPSITRLKHKFSVVPAVTFGYKLQEDLAIYAKVGANIARFNLDNTYIAADDYYTSTDSKTFTKVGLELGVGAEYAVTKNWSLTGDVSYTRFNATTFNLSNPTIDLDGDTTIPNATHTASVKPRFIAVRLGATYRF